MKFIPVYDQVITNDDAKAAYNAVSSGILSWFGPEVKKLEDRLKQLVGSKHAIVCSSGTTGLFLALAPFFRNKKCTVAVPTCSYAATAFSVYHHGGTVLFIDADRNTWNMDLNVLEEACKSQKIDIVMAVSNYGNPYDMNKLIELSSKYDFEIVEDACEAFTSSFDNKKIGSFGKIGVFSFYGNKFGGFSGEGGAVVTDDDDIYKYLRLLNGQGQDPTRKFWHLIPGNNFRMTNVQAAILNSQLNRLDTTILKKNHIAALYKQYLDSDLKWQVVPHTGIHCYWMVTVSHWLDVNWYDKLQTILKNNNIESRPVFPAIHTMPAASYIDAIFYGNYSNSEFLNRNGICLPSGPGTTDEEIKFVCTVINNAI